MNQFITDNHYRRYPFYQSASLAFNDALIVDAQIVLSTDFNIYNAGSVSFDSTVSQVGETDLVFAIQSVELSGYTLQGTISDTASEDTRVILTLVDGSDVPHPELGYGFVMVGSVASLLTYGKGVSFTAIPLDPAVIRVFYPNKPVSLYVGNMTRPGPSVFGETIGAASSFELQGRVPVTTQGCTEATTAPDVDQVSVDAVGEVTEIAVPIPDAPITEITNTTITTVTVHDIDILDALPVLPTAYDAVVEGGVACVAGCVVGAGYNVALSGDLADKIIEFTYQLGGGLGVDCDAVPGYPELGTLAVDCVKSLNGCHTFHGALTLQGGTGVSLVPDPAGHRILVLVNASDLTRAAP